MNFLSRSILPILLLISRSRILNELMRKISLSWARFTLHIARTLFPISLFVIKGSILTKDWRLGLSDIDIILVSENKENLIVIRN